MFGTNYTREEIQKIFRSLPEDLQDAIGSMETTEFLRDLGEQHGLHLDEMGALNEEVNATMFGLRRTADLTDRIHSRVKRLDKTEIYDMVKEISDKIFAQARRSMEEIHEKHEKEGIIHDTKPDTASTNTDTDKIFEERMTKMFNLPQKKDSGESSVPEIKKYERQDPYREPVE